MPIELPLHMDEADRKVLESADAWRRLHFPTSMAPDDALAVHRNYGVDFATAVLYSHFAERVPIEFSAQPKGGSTGVLETPKLAIVPGAFHEHYPHLGADGGTVCETAREHGWPSFVIPIPGLGSLEDNARSIIGWFDMRSSETFTVVTISKGAADMRVALARRPDLWRQLRGWICISGILNGTPIANWLLERKLYWLTMTMVLWYWNVPRGNLAELCHNGNSLNKPWASVDEIPCGEHCRHPVQRPIQIVGFPLRKHLAGWRSRMWHRRFAAHGPSDGVIWLSDLLRAPTTVIPIWGADHYMRPSSTVATICARIVTTLSSASTAEHSV